MTFNTARRLALAWVRKASTRKTLGTKTIEHLTRWFSSDTFADAWQDYPADFKESHINKWRNK